MPTNSFPPTLLSKKLERSDLLQPGSLDEMHLPIKWGIIQTKHLYQDVFKPPKRENKQKNPNGGTISYHPSSHSWHPSLPTTTWQVLQNLPSWLIACKRKNPWSLQNWNYLTTTKLKEAVHAATPVAQLVNTFRPMTVCKHNHWLLFLCGSNSNLQNEECHPMQEMQVAVHKRDTKPSLHQASMNTGVRQEAWERSSSLFQQPRPLHRWLLYRSDWEDEEQRPWLQKEERELLHPPSTVRDKPGPIDMPFPNTPPLCNYVADIMLEYEQLFFFTRHVWCILPKQHTCMPSFVHLNTTLIFYRNTVH